MSSIKLDRRQRDKLNKFVSFTDAPQDSAIKCLQRFKWQVEQATNDYFENPHMYVSHSQPKVNLKKIAAVFKKYQESDDKIGFAGTIALCKDLNTAPTDVVMVVLSWKMKSPAVGQFPVKDFTSGMSSLGCDSVEDLKKKLPELRKSMIEDEETFSKVYNFAYGWSKEETKKQLDLNTAISMWKLLLTGKFKQIDTWLDFIKKNNASIPKDLWEMLLVFIKDVKADDFSDYDELSAWPVTIDEFVEDFKENL